MKKFLGAIVSGLAGVLSLIFLAIPAFSIEFMGEAEKYSGWKLLKTDDITKFGEGLMNMKSNTSLTLYRVFAWILVIIAIVLIVLAVLQLLSALGVVKMPAIIDTVAKYALIALAVVSIFALIANFGIRSEFINFAKDKKFPEEAIKQLKEMFSIGASLWIVAITNIAAAVCGNLFVKKAK
jgi:hypothetical protein